uniref:Uncharacterized protein n=1 Tax=Nelumbo nucifera TaxID=4432 RepID=A0A822ZDE9_NELNU|nr:TPA_asm: hypothetical protein HUJ06_015768 [Nelumbo nucifera]
MLHFRNNVIIQLHLLVIFIIYVSFQGYASQPSANNAVGVTLTVGSFSLSRTTSCYLYIIICVRNFIIFRING